MNERFIAMARIARASAVEPKKHRPPNRPKEIRVGVRILSLLKKRPRTLEQIAADVKLPTLAPQTVSDELKKLVKRGMVKSFKVWSGEYTNSGRKRFITRYGIPGGPCDGSSE